MDSILVEIKKMLGLGSEYNVFDPEIIVYINNAIMILEQLGVCQDGFVLTDDTQVWEDLLPDISKLEGVKTYIYIWTRLMFDPPANATLRDILEKTKSELEWRLNVKAEQMSAEG